MTDAERWFLSDRAIEDSSYDAFAHEDLAGQLQEIVESVTPPATVGLLGGFGTGKSSIGNLLAKRMKGHDRFQVVSLSAEKHSETARQRALVYSFSESLRTDAGIADRDIRKILDRIEESESSEVPELRTFPISTLLRGIRSRHALFAVAAFAAAYAIAALLCLLVHVLGGTAVNPFLWPLTTAYLSVPLVFGLLALILPLVQPWLSAALTPLRKSHTRPRAEAADEIERVFAELVQLVPKNKRLIIIVDDIDRLAPDEVLDALATIKTLQAVPRDRPPTFIISCDDSIVRNAIKRAQPGPSPVNGSRQLAAEEYLNKLFVVRQPLPPHLKEDMQEYASGLMHNNKNVHAGTAALGDDLDSVLEILIHDGVNDPRHVIRLLNAFFTDYRLAKVREGSGGRLGKGEITRNPLTLARLAVLRVDFPRWYEAIREEFDLLNVLDLHVLGHKLDEVQRRTLDEALSELGDPERNADRTVEDSASAANRVSALSLPTAFADFLRRTAHYVEQDVPIAPFFYFGQTPAGRILGSRTAEEIRRALENNDIDAIRIQLTDEPTIVQAAVDQMITILGSARAGLPLRNAVATSAAALREVPKDRQTDLADTIAARIQREPDSVPQPELLAEVIRFANNRYRYALTTQIVELETEPDRAYTRAMAILSLAEEKPTDPQLINGLDRYFIGLPANAGWSDTRPWLVRVNNIETQIRDKIFRDSFYVAHIKAAVGTTEDAIDASDVGIFLKLIDTAPDSIRASHDIVTALRECISSKGVEPRWFAIRILGHVQAREDEVVDLAVAVAAVVNDEVVTAYSETRLDAMRLFVDWTTTYESAFASASPEAVEALITAVAAAATSTGDEDDDAVRAAAEAASALARIWPERIGPALTALITTFTDHRNPVDPVGLAIQNALLQIIPVADENGSAVISEALFGPLDTATAEDDPAVQMSIEAIVPTVHTLKGKAIVTARAASWISRYSRPINALNDIRPQLSALRTAARNGAVSGKDQQALVSRAEALTQQGSVATDAAAVTLAHIPWAAPRRADATNIIAGAWDQLAEPIHAEITRHLASWSPAAGEIAPLLAEQLVTFAVAHEDSDTASAWLDQLWPALSATDRSTAIVGTIDGSVALRTRMKELTPEELLGAFKTAAKVGSVDVVFEASSVCDENTRAEAAKQFIESCFDDADAGWDYDSVSRAVALLNDQTASGIVNAVIPYFKSGAAQAGHAALVIGSIHAAHPGADAPARSEIDQAIRGLLPDADPNFAHQLGTASQGSAWSNFEGIVKEMRRKASNQTSREAADAFINGRGRK